MFVAVYPKQEIDVSSMQAAKQFDDRALNICRVSNRYFAQLVKHDVARGCGRGEGVERLPRIKLAALQRGT